MKVALIVDEFSLETGTGIARYCQSLLQGLRDNGIDVTPIHIDSPAIPYGQTVNHVFRLPYHILRHVNDFDLWHATSPVTGLCFPFIRKPRVVTYHDMASILSKYAGSSLHVSLFAPLFYRIGKYSDKAIAVSTLTEEDMVRYLKFPPGKINVINHGVERKFQPLDNKTKGDVHIIGYIGALDERKRLDYAIRALGILRDGHPELNVKFLIYGSRGTQKTKLMELARELRLTDHIRFMGFAEDSKLTSIYNSFDVFVMPSEWEGFGIPVLEAQRCGVPVIIRQSAHIPGEVAKCCLKAVSEKDMADRIYELLTIPSLRERIVAEGLKYSQQFAWERTVERTIEVYEEVLSRGSRNISR